MLNEPHPGYINLGSLYSYNYNTDLHLSYIRQSISLSRTKFKVSSSLRLRVLPARSWPSDQSS